MASSIQSGNPLLDSLLDRFEDLPLRLTIPQAAIVLKEKLPSIRAQISRNTFPVTVRRIKGGSQYVMLSDLL